MADTVNVTISNAFDQWRFKTNELYTAICDLDNLTEPNTRGTNVISALTHFFSNLLVYRYPGPYIEAKYKGLIL